MAPLIGAFRQKYPGIELIISEFGGRTVQSAIVSGELDLAMNLLSIDESLGLTSIPLFSYPMCAVVPRSEKWLNRTRLPISELADESILIYNEDFALHGMLMESFAAHGFTPKIATRSGQWDFLAAMVQAGMGVAILPEPICRRLDSSLMWMPIEPEMLWKLELIWREGSYMSHSTQAWIAMCREHYRQQQKDAHAG
jgi:DNA-binding transcriptional LysR family regulator